MKTLELGRERSYMPNEVGLETPFIFNRLPLFLLFQSEGFAIQARNLQTSLGRQVIEAAISTLYYDRAVIPVWMIDGQLPNGFFSGVLKPQINRHPYGIEIIRNELEFYLYMEQEELMLQGVGYRDNGKPDAITVLARQIDNSERKTKLTPEFEVDFSSHINNPNGLMSIQFRNLL